MTMYTRQTAQVQTSSSPHTLPNRQDTALTTSISRILQVGVLCSSIMIVAGLVLLAMQVGGTIPQSAQVFPHTLAQVWSGLLQLQPQAVIAAGLLILIATPVLRVIASVIAFSREQDRRYALIALILLAILLTSFMLGKGGA